MAMQFLVIDGADQGQTFLLPEQDTVTIGSNKKHAFIVLHDLYVARVHCQVDIKGESISVTDHDTPAGTLVNGTKVKQKDLHLGDVVRVGNSHLKLQVCGEAAPPPPVQTAAQPALPTALGTAGKPKAPPNLWEVLHNKSTGAAPAEAPPPPPEPEKPAGLPHYSAEELPELSGHTLGIYELGEVIGKRHWGVVFRAIDTKKNQDVALRVLADFPANDKEMQTFTRVLRGVLPIRHPHIVSLLNAGKTGPYGWIATEFIEGESLVDVIERIRTKPKIKWLRGLRVGIHIARALEFTHQRHMFHGHITPGNILVQNEDNCAKLNDLVLHQALAGSESSHNLAEERWQDNLLYRSPEQTFTGSMVDDLSDQYALGCIVYTLLTGKPPFEGPTPKETVNLIRNATPLKPTELQPTIPIALQAVVMRMIAKHQEDRYPTPTDVRKDLEKIAAEHGEEM